MLNKIFIMGRLTKDVECKRTQGGTAVANFTLAVDRDFKGQNGEKSTDFIECVAWKNNAEFVSKYFSKGKMAIVEGRLQLRDWKDKDGNNRKTVEIIAEAVYFADSKPQTNSGNDNVAAYEPVFEDISGDGEPLPF